MIYVCIAGLALLMGLWYVAPLLRQHKQILPIILLAPHMGTLPRFERLLAALQKNHFQTIVPSQLLAGTLPKRPVLLLLTEGYQTYMQLLPLLKKYNSKMAVSVPVQYIGRYDGWKKQGPWQNILTAAQLQTLQQSKRVEIVSQAMNPQAGQTTNPQQLLWQLQESKTRLQHLCQVPVCACLFTPPALNAELTSTLKTIYPLYISRQTGNNTLPLDGYTLRVQPLKHTGLLARFCWKLSR